MSFLELYPHYPWILDTEHYNCSNRTPEQWAARGTPQPVMGGFAVVSVICPLYALFTSCQEFFGNAYKQDGLGCFCLLLYMLTVSAMTNRDYLKHPCYQMMYFTTLVDMLNLIFSNFFTGFYFIVGATFCTYPNSIYFWGAIGIGSWCCSSFSIVSLGLGRLAEITGYCKWIFEGHMSAFWIGLCLTYWAFVATMTRPMVFNSTAGAWILVPFIDDDFAKELKKYRNVILPANNLLSPMIISLIYVLIFLSLCNQEKQSVDKNTARFHRKVLLQCTLICLTQAAVGFTFFCLIMFSVPHWFLLIAQGAYQLNECTPPIACLIFNTTIRNRVLGMLGIKSSAVASINSRTAHSMSRNIIH